MQRTNDPNTPTPKWTSKHDAIVKRYEQRVAEGKVKYVVIVPRDADSTKLK